MTEIAKVEHGPISVHMAPDISDLMRLAIEKGADGVDALEKLVALRERVEDRNAKHAFYRALAEFQAECPAIQKVKPVDFVSKRTGAKVKYGYAPLDHIVGIIRPIAAKHDLSFSWDQEEAAGKLTVTCILRHIDGFGQESRFTCPLTKDNALMSDAQNSGAANSYAKRQSLVSVTGIVTTDEDTDGADESTLEPITEDAVMDLEALLTEVGAKREPYLAMLGIERLEDLPKAQLGTATRMLEAKRRKA